MFENLTKVLEDFVDQGVPGCDCVVYHKGKCVYRKFIGYSDKENKIEMNGKEIYNLYSCSKVMTCTAALMLYERGMYKLEDKLSDYLPEFETMYVQTGDGLKKAQKSITIKDLFCMTAGLTYNLYSPMLRQCKKDTNGKCPTREVMKYLAKEPLSFEPGDNWQYSLCHDVLAALVEVVSGMKFGEFMKKNIFEPLGMENSTYLLDDSEIQKVSMQYHSGKYVPYGKGIEYKLGTEYESGGAGGISTVDDYIKFLEGLRTGKLISFDTIKLMSTNHVTRDKLATYWVNNYGYGLGVRCKYEDESITDFGWNGAAGAHAIIDMENEYTLYYAQNVLACPVEKVGDLLMLAAREQVKQL